MAQMHLLHLGGDIAGDGIAHRRAQQLGAQLGAERVHRQAVFLEPALELGGIISLGLVELAIHLGVGDLNTHLGGSLLDERLINHPIEHLAPHLAQRCFLFGGRLARHGLLAEIALRQRDLGLVIGERNGLPIHQRRRSGGRRLVTGWLRRHRVASLLGSSGGRRGRLGGSRGPGRLGRCR